MAPKNFADVKDDYYAILGITQAADQNLVRRQYLQLSKTTHPDKTSGFNTTAQFQLVNEAYSVLSDPQSRARYDMHYPIIKAKNTPAPPYPPQSRNFHAARRGTCRRRSAADMRKLLREKAAYMRRKAEAAKTAAAQHVKREAAKKAAESVIADIIPREKSYTMKLEEERKRQLQVSRKQMVIGLQIQKINEKRDDIFKQAYAIRAHAYFNIQRVLQQTHYEDTYACRRTPKPQCSRALKEKRRKPVRLHHAKYRQLLDELHTSFRVLERHYIQLGTEAQDLQKDLDKVLAESQALTQHIMTLRQGYNAVVQKRMDAEADLNRAHDADTKDPAKSQLGKHSICQHEDFWTVMSSSMGRTRCPVCYHLVSKYYICPDCHFKACDRCRDTLRGSFYPRK